MLLEAGANFESRRGEDGRTPLVECVDKWQHVVEAFIAAGAHVDAKDYRGRGLSHIVINQEDSSGLFSCTRDRINLLADKYGLDPTELDFEGNNLLHLAVTNGPSPYHLSDIAGQVECVIDSIVGFGVSPLARNKAGQTPLHVLFDDSKPWTSTEPETDDTYEIIVKALQKTGGDAGINERDNAGLTPLHHAALSSRDLGPLS
ncbi:Transient receptor potential cation channel subfamily A member 1 [Colletotrichum orbiculare MAFF 240422]|uniref:Transient receptor potential cation channel subfamily A member 1 n=1 Tax=Colletotrichum orbiculare (strain 104-T / ATCC 96160 / CBS 514.97 / LARS 414 / MAFF 240422) TaxID=1213857 RepID=A0A484FCL1_COLOR|nr:Transient receptor potential cation channel subfamily A member 1 [Colletotrichum orbiculare MAFF 240422]